jgi:cation:H+ antiporter
VLLTIALLVVGLVLLVAGGEALVRGGSGLGPRRRACRRWSSGLTLVAFATSAPELAVSVDAALSGSPGWPSATSSAATSSTSCWSWGLAASCSRSPSAGSWCAPTCRS